MAVFEFEKFKVYVHTKWYKVDPIMNYVYERNRTRKLYESPISPPQLFCCLS